MRDELQYMLRKMIVIDSIVGLILTIITYIIFKGYAFIFLFGYLLACMNFFISSFVARATFYNENFNGQGIMLLSSGIKVLFVSVVGVILFKYNHTNVIPYMAGYTSHFVPIILYGTNKKNFWKDVIEWRNLNQFLVSTVLV